MSNPGMSGAGLTVGRADYSQAKDEDLVRAVTANQSDAGLNWLKFIVDIHKDYAKYSQNRDKPGHSFLTDLVYNMSCANTFVKDVPYDVCLKDWEACKAKWNAGFVSGGGFEVLEGNLKNEPQLQKNLNTRLIQSRHGIILVDDAMKESKDYVLRKSKTVDHRLLPTPAFYRR